MSSIFKATLKQQEKKNIFLLHKVTFTLSDFFVVVVKNWIILPDHQFSGLESSFNTKFTEIYNQLSLTQQFKMIINVKTTCSYSLLRFNFLLFECFSI